MDMAEALDDYRATNGAAVRSIRSEQNLVFVTGASRSGTTMLARILGNHSKILALNELHFFGDLCPVSSDPRPLEPAAVKKLTATLVARQSHGLWGATRPAENDDAVKRICAAFGDRSPTAYQVFSAVCADVVHAAGKTIACEQTPRNIFYVATALQAFSGAKFVHLVRDPRAVAASQRNRWQLRRLGADRVPRTELVRTWVNYHPLTMAKLWRHATLAADKMKNHPAVQIVKFEKLVTEPDAVLVQLCNFLGVDFEPAMLEVPRWGSSNLRHDLPVAGISTDVVDRWKEVLDEGEIRVVEHLTADVMARYDYETCGRTSTYSSLLLLRYLLSYPFHLVGVALANPRRAWIQLTAMFSS